MKTKSVKKLIIKILSAVAMLAGLIYFHVYFGYWWDRPNFRDDIDKVIISEGGFVPPGVEYFEKTILPESPECQRIIKVIKNGWKYEPLVLLKTSSYTVEIIHADGSVMIVDVFGNFMRIKSHGDVQIFRSIRNVSEIIEEELKIAK